MKTKYTTLLSIFIVALLLAISGCGGGSSSPEPDPDPDTTPDAFTFNSVETIQLSTWIESNSITVSGINAATSISVANGEYRIGMGSFTQAAGQVSAGSTIIVRVMSADSAGQTSTVTLTIGGVSSDFDVTTIASDTTPDQFSFTAVETDQLSSWIESETITISGINANSPISVSNGEYQVDGGSYTSNASEVANGAQIRVRVMSASTEGQSTSTTLSVGGVSADFTVTTAQTDSTPDPFEFQAVQTTDLSTWIESNSVTVSGINTASPISITGGEYRIDNGSYSQMNSEVTNGQTVTVRVMSAATAGQSSSATLTIGGVSADFTVSTIAQGPIITRESNLSCIAPAQVSSGNSDIQLEAAFPDLPSMDALIGLFQAPGDSTRWYAMRQNGMVYWFDNAPTASTLNTFFDARSLVDYGGERGLLGMAFHPQYASNGQIYLSYIASSSRDSIVSRVTLNGSGDVDLASEEILLTIDQPAGNHNGGNIAFGPDGYLYLGYGDGGGSGDQYGHGQNTQSLLATMLRIDVSGQSGYTVPADNPFVGNANVLDEIYAYGLRNPWRWSFDSQTGELWAADVGQNAYEEVNLINAGDNLGWPIMEGNHCYDANTCDQTGLTLPVAEYGHSQGCSVTGGFVYRGQSIASLQGNYLFGDFCSGRIWQTSKDAQQNYQTAQLLDSSLSIASFAQGHDGEVYVLNHSGSAGTGIYKFVDANGGADNIPANLSDTGCFASTADKTYAQGVVPFDVRTELWSDGVDKTRLFAIPDATNISIEADGDFEYPQGSILIKNFIYQGQYIETRLFMRHANGWGGYSYKWAENESDATLVEGSDSVIIGGFEHIIPSRAQCFECHTNTAGISLGPEASQLNFDLQYPNGNTGNQLAALSEATYLAEHPSQSQITEMADIADANASIELKSRSYLHANCSGCHRPGGPGSSMDLRIQTALADTMACDVVPSNGDLGITNARLIAPGESARSVLIARLQDLGADRMPPLGSQVVDSDAVTIITQWVDSLSNCQ